MCIRDRSKTLLVMWVIIFEDGVFSCKDPCDKILCGYIAALVHTRARFSDILFCTNILLDVNSAGIGYLELLASEIKTARTKESKKQFVPFICPTQGVASRPWAKERISQRRKQGIEHFSCLLPSLGPDGKWIDHPCDSDACSNWMKNVLVMHGVKRDSLLDLTSQGFKATGLSLSLIHI